jgi:hypothetical protein
MLDSCQDYIPITEYVKRHFFLSAGAGATVVPIGGILAFSACRTPARKSREGIRLSRSDLLAQAAPPPLEESVLRRDSDKAVGFM